MAQLPPKVPNWPDFPHHKMDAVYGAPGGPSWVDEFLDFSSSRRGSHRRSMSDSIAFLDAAAADECRRSSAIAAMPDGNTDMMINDDNAAGGDQFDDDQLMSMFADVGPTLSNDPSSSPSDHNSINDEDKPTMMQLAQQPKNEPEEVQSSCDSDGLLIGGSLAAAAAAAAAAADNSGDRIVDPKRIKRILANRQSAQRSRVRKLQYISELERSVTSLQAEVSVLSPRVAFLDHQRLVLNVDNSVLKQRIAVLAQDKVFKDAHQEALKREIERLRQIYYQQNLKKMENANGLVPKSPSAAPEKEQLQAAAAAVN